MSFLVGEGHFYTPNYDGPFRVIIVFFITVLVVWIVSALTAFITL